MGFMDKVKAQATVLAEKAQEGAKAGQAKLSEMQAKKHADALLLELGGIVYTQQVGPCGGRRGREGCRAGRGAPPVRDRARAGHGDFCERADCLQTVPSSRRRRRAGDTPPPASTPAATTVPGGGGMPQFSGGIPTGSYSSDTEEEATPATEETTS